MKKTVAVASVCTTLFSAASAVNAAEMVTTENLNVRQKPTTTAAKLGVLPKNTTINVTSISNGWGQFQYQGQTAYVTAQYLKVKESSNTQLNKTKKYTVNTTVLNVRAQASASSTKIGTVYQGEQLNVIKKESNGWYKIKHDGKTGYVSGDYVTVKEVSSNTPPSSSSEVDKTKSYIVNTDVLNVRDKASASGKQLGQVRKGTSLTVLGKESNGWYKINYNGKTGYVSGDYVTVKDASSSTPPPSSSEVDKTKSYIVNTDVLNVRDKASASGKQLGQVKKGTSLTVLGKESNGWYKIKHDGKTGYVSGDYVTVKEVSSNTPPSSSSEVDKTKSYIVNTDVLNVRDKASASGKQLGQVKKGTSLTVLGKESNGWYKINYNGKTGYVSGDYVTVKDASSSTPPPSSSEVDKTKLYIVNTDVLNVRDKASASGKQLGQVKKGTSLTVLGKESNGWYKISYNGKTGYVSGDYVTVKDASSNTTPPSSSEIDKTKSYIVNTDVLNVRDKASTSGKQIGQVRKGTSLTVLGKESNGWYKINYNGKTGYVSGDYVTVKDTSNSVTPPSSTTKTYVVAVNSLNIRSGPADTYSVIGSYKLNTRIQSNRLVDGWLEVTYNGKKGYVSSQYVKEVSDVIDEGVLKNRVIVLDPGHGGHDPGAVNHNGVLEKNITLNVARYAEPLLEKLGANVILTRTSDTYLTLSERTRIAEDIEADAFLSIHANSSTSDSANGLETWYYSSGRAVMASSERDAKSKILAQMVQEELVVELGLTDRGIKEGSFYVIANTRSMPSALTELGFVSNPKESLFIDDTAVQKRMAQAITRGFIRFFATY